MENNLPTEAEIIALHKKHAPTEALFNASYSHCLAVWKIAEQLITSQNLNLDQELVKAACLLHDIGIYKLIQPTEPLNVGPAKRGIVAEQMLEEEGLPKALRDIVAHHVGHNLTRERIEEGLLGVLPPRDLTPRTAEERLVNYVSKLHGRSENPQFISVDAYRAFLKKIEEEYYVNDFESLVKEFGEPDLQPLAKEFTEELV